MTVSTMITREKGQGIEKIIKTAMRFSKEVSLASLATHIYSLEAVALTQDELAMICERLDYYVTTVMYRSRPMRVVRRMVSKATRAARTQYTGIDMCEQIQRQLDGIMKVGERRPTYEVYPLVRGAFAGGDILTSNKITMSLDSERYRVKQASVDGLTTRCVFRVS